MDVRRRLILALLGGAASVVAGCTRDLDPATMQLTGTGGNTGATDARVKADSQCQYDVDAVRVSTDDAGVACLYLIAPPDPNLAVDRFRIVVDGVPLPPDPTNGWTYTDATQRVVQIVGPTCDAINAGNVRTVWVEWYCYGIA